MRNRVIIAASGLLLLVQTPAGADTYRIETALTSFAQNTQPSAPASPLRGTPATPDGIGSPTRMVRELYEKMESNELSAVTNPVTGLNMTLTRSYFSPELVPLLVRNYKCFFRPGREGQQLLVSGSDSQLSNVRVKVLLSTADAQTVEVQFKNFESDQSRVFQFRSMNNRWLIDDIFVDGESMRAAMKKGCT
jgi:hypothetical protein